jgi:hypothetical protein
MRIMYTPVFYYLCFTCVLPTLTPVFYCSMPLFDDMNDARASKVTLVMMLGHQ